MHIFEEADYEMRLSGVIGRFFKEGSIPMEL